MPKFIKCFDLRWNPINNIIQLVGTRNVVVFKVIHFRGTAIGSRLVSGEGFNVSVGVVGIFAVKIHGS